MSATVFDAFRIALAHLKPEDLAHIRPMPEKPTLADAEEIIAEFAMVCARKTYCE